ncbi:MAG: polysaccharide biosynthesis protein [Chryseobacterium sp.]|uniref:lipopolysaccharide biosynthesis protein n=1 Tax=Chryseobacterium sp. TaxID=1871047 RepID=UPI002626E2E3|nr:polysaccharide biosynthesis protein [Chryseobacterium sp.]MDF2553887.1 polysaccharide biosynthesis protein [Chryseobacterium sp.]
MKKIKKYLVNFGVNEAVFYTVLGRLLQGIGGLATVVLVSQFLSKNEQGYYYTFSSILAIQIFFELGLSGIIVQFAAHEMAHLKFSADSMSFIGNEKNLSRLSSLFKFTLKWFSYMSLILIIILCVFGFFFFSYFGGGNDYINWKSPWIIVSLATSFSLILNAILSFFEGVGKIKDIAKLRLFQILTQLIILSVGFTFGLKLFAFPVANLLALLVVFVCIICSSKLQFLKRLWKIPNTYKINYKKEIFPLQWKISLSWISGYFIYQIFNPLIFIFEGPVSAGRMGMTLAVINGILLISLSWVNTRIPVFSNLIAKNEYEELDQLFNRTLLQSTIISIVGIFSFVVAFFCLQHFDIEYYRRFLPLSLIIILSFGYVINQIISSLAIYLRSHKKEPLLQYSIVSAILICSSTLFMGKYFGVNGIVYGFTIIIAIICLPWSLYIFLSKKKEWHSK